MWRCARGARRPQIQQQRQYDQEEIDKTIDLMMDIKKSGQFARSGRLRPVGQPDGLGRGCDSVDVVAGGDRVKTRGSAVRFQPLREDIGLGLHPGAMKHLAGSARLLL